MSALMRLAFSALAIGGVGLGLRALEHAWFSRAVTGAGRLPRLRDGVPAVLYFFSPGCTSCRTVQGPALEQLRDRWRGGLQVVAIDALAGPALADRWGVLAVPTTIVLDARGIARRAHFGVASAERLAASLREALARHGP
jgi:thiol-disulfide isomerase/thioredoxin